jgi:carbon starvation protein CstA
LILKCLQIWVFIFSLAIIKGYFSKKQTPSGYMKAETLLAIVGVQYVANRITLRDDSSVFRCFCCLNQAIASVCLCYIVAFLGNFNFRPRLVCFIHFIPPFFIIFRLILFLGIVSLKKCLISTKNLWFKPVYFPNLLPFSIFSNSVQHFPK